QHVVGIDIGEAGHGDGMRRMQMHHRLRRRAFAIHGDMEERLLRRRIARQQFAAVVELRQACGIEAGQGDGGRRPQPAAVHPRADVAGAAEGEPALEQRLAVAHDRLAQGGLVHGSIPKALSKKSTAPKLPDLSANASAGSPMLAVQGTPGSICGPMRSALIPRRWTTAPAVSPPATISRRTPAAPSPAAISATAPSLISPPRAP